MYFYSALLPLFINVLVMIFFNSQIKRYNDDYLIIPKMIFALVCVGSLVPYISYGLFVVLIISAVIGFSNEDWYFANPKIRDNWKN